MDRSVNFRPRDREKVSSINMKIIVAFTFALIVGTLALSDEQKAKLKEYKDSCIIETGVDAAIVENAKNGNIAEDDDKLPCFAACFLKKMAILSPEGNLNEEVLHAKLPSSIPKDKAEEVIQKCKSLGGASICEKGGNLMKCFLQNKKFIILN